MAELPEIHQLSRQMDEVLKGKVCNKIEIRQKKCTNLPLGEIKKRIIGARVQRVYNKGKWLIIRLGNGENILISLGMGGDLLYFSPPESGQKEYQVKLMFTDKSGFTIKFWWFGKFYVCNEDELVKEKSIKDIAINPFDEGFTYGYFRELFRGRRGKVKAFLLNQKNVSGIGNMYIHDILFESNIHPEKQITDVTEDEFKELYDHILGNLQHSYSKGGFSYEKDFFGQSGEYSADEFLIAYKKDGRCPNCGAEIQVIKTGGTTSYICPKCQHL